MRRRSRPTRGLSRQKKNLSIFVEECLKKINAFTHDMYVTGGKRLGEFSQVMNTNFRVLLFGMQLVFRNNVTISGY